MIKNFTELSQAETEFNSSKSKTSVQSSRLYKIGSRYVVETDEQPELLQEYIKPVSVEPVIKT